MKNLFKTTLYGIKEIVEINMNQETMYDEELKASIYTTEDGRHTYYDGDKKAWMPIWYYSCK